MAPGHYSEPNIVERPWTNVRRCAITIGVAVGLLSSNSAFALQEATPDTSPIGPPPLPEKCTVIASELMNHRFVPVGDDGTIYVSKAGVGGDEVLESPADPVATPDSPGTPAL